MNQSLAKTRPQASAPTWQLVVSTDQCFRQRQSGVLFDVATVRNLSIGDCHSRGCAWPDAEVTLRPVDIAVPTDEDVRLTASSLCGSDAWERLPDDDAETIMWGGGTKVGPVGAR